MSARRSASLRLGVDAWGLSGPLYFTGMGQYAVTLLRWLPRVAPEITITAYCGPSEERPSWLPESVGWRPVGRRLPAKLSALYSWTVSLPRQLRADRIGVFHAPAVHMRPFFPPVPAVECAVVATLHDLIPMSYYDIRTLPLRQRLFYRLNVRRAVRATTLITVSAYSRAEIASLLRVDAARIVVIHNAIDFAPNPDTTPLASLGIRPPYLLFAGSYEPRKNLAGALGGYAALVRNGFSHPLVAIVDQGSGHASTSPARLRQLRIEDRVRFVDSLSDTQIRSLYTHAEALLFPSLAEGFGMPPLQAAACGVPVVASELPVLREVLGDCATYVDPQSADSIADGVIRALSDESLRRRGPIVAAQFSPSANTSKHLDAYEAAVAIRASGSRPSTRREEKRRETLAR